MPAGRVNQTMYLGTSAGSNIEKMNEVSLWKAGELGSKIETVSKKAYQLVQLDSGAVAANGVGVVAAGQLAYWKDKTNYIVTNDFRQALGASNGCRNEAAGIFTVAATAGYYCVVQQRGKNSAVTLKSSSPNVGDWIVPDNSTSTAQCDVVATATAPTVQPVGKAAGSGSGVTTIAVDLDFPEAVV